MTNGWLLLFFAGLCEIGWPVGFKLAELTQSRFLWIGFSIVSMTASGVLLYMAQRYIPIGTAYAVWTGIGAMGTFLIGVAFFNDLLSVGRLVGLCLIVAGVIVLKLAS